MKNIIPKKLPAECQIYIINFTLRKGILWVSRMIRWILNV